MRNFLSRLVNSIKKHKILSAMIAIIIILFAWWAFVNLTPKPLGDKMEYLGKEDYGCWVGFCDARPYSVYYYGTDMSEEEVVGYFNAQYSPLENLAFKNARFTTNSGEFILTYETSGPAANPKKYVVSIVDSQYNIAKEHLKK